VNINHSIDIQAIRAAERIYGEWHEALGRKDIDAARPSVVRQIGGGHARPVFG
jgi:hypothetical protein